MKKNIVKPLFLFMSFLILALEINSQIERYTLTSLRGTMVYFPKDNRTYINELINSQTKDKFLHLAEIYLEMNEKEQALFYLENYKGDNWEFRNKISEKLGLGTFAKEFQGREIKISKEIENYSKIRSLDNLIDYTLYFKSQGDKEKNIYEKLFRYKFENKEEDFWKLYKSLELEVFDRNIKEELFLFQLLKDDFEGAKKISFTSPQLFLNLLNYMQYVKAPENQIRAFVEEFIERFPDENNAEIFKFQWKFLMNESEKISKTEEYLRENFDQEIFEEYYKKTKNLIFLKDYLVKLVFDKGHEKYINYLISLDKSYEDEKYLSLLFDKSYLFSYFEKNSKKIEEEFISEYIEYLYINKNYKKLYEYREKLNFPLLKILYSSGYKDVELIIRRKYPLELEFADLKNLKYFYFNENFVFDEVLIKELERLKQLNSVETYYLSRYYKKIGQSEKAKELLYGLRENYNFEK